MIRRTYHGAQPDRTGGEDRPAPACAGRTEPYDTLIDVTSGPVFHWAVAEARAICSTCDLFAECMTANRGERWAEAVLGDKRAPKYVSDQRRALATSHARERHAALSDLVARGGRLEEALAMLGMTTRHQLYKWCHRNKALDLWRALTPHLKRNQHRTGAAA